MGAAWAFGTWLADSRGWVSHLPRQADVEPGLRALQGAAAQQQNAPGLFRGISVTCGRNPVGIGTCFRNRSSTSKTGCRMGIHPAARLTNHTLKVRNPSGGGSVHTYQVFRGKRAPSPEPPKPVEAEIQPGDGLLIRSGINGLYTSTPEIGFRWLGRRSSRACCRSTAATTWLLSPRPLPVGKLFFSTLQYTNSCCLVKYTLAVFFRHGSRSDGDPVTRTQSVSEVRTDPR